MSAREDALIIHVYPDPVLRARAKEVKDIGEHTQELIDGMIECMYSAPGIGLAANQVGNLKRVIVFDIYREGQEREPGVLINPEIVHGEGEITWEEACLSVVDFSSEVTRNACVKVRGADRHGKPLEIDAEGLLAVCLQHEIDHLNGMLFIDRISSLKRALYKKRLRKSKKGA